jgi:hypothetical protein
MKLDFFLGSLMHSLMTGRDITVVKRADHLDISK